MGEQRKTIGRVLWGGITARATVFGFLTFLYGGLEGWTAEGLGDRYYVEPR